MVESMAEEDRPPSRGNKKTFQLEVDLGKETFEVKPLGLYVSFPKGKKDNLVIFL